MERVFIGLGSNLGDREMYMERALSALKDGIEVLKVSDIIETEPVGPVKQGDFLNAVVMGTTSLTPAMLLDFLLEIEEGLGRKREGRWGPRVIDCDILLYGTTVMDIPGLTLPHPEICSRRFVLEQLLSLAPDLKDPLSGRQYSEILSSLSV